MRFVLSNASAKRQRPGKRVVPAAVCFLDCRAGSRAIVNVEAAICSKVQGRGHQMQESCYSWGGNRFRRHAVPKSQYAAHKKGLSPADARSFGTHSFRLGSAAARSARSVVSERDERGWLCPRATQAAGQCRLSAGTGDARGTWEPDQGAANGGRE